MISLLIGFEETLQQWKTWDNVTVIQNHQAIKDHLCDLFRRGLDVQVRFVVDQLLKFSPLTRITAKPYFTR